MSGRSMKTDLMSFIQGGKRILSFTTQSLGLMADLDLGTEHLRWMGGQAFMYGMLRGRKYASGYPHPADQPQLPINRV